MANVATSRSDTPLHRSNGPLHRSNKPLYRSDKPVTRSVEASSFPVPVNSPKTSRMAVGMLDPLKHRRMVFDGWRNGGRSGITFSRSPNIPTREIVRLMGTHRRSRVLCRSPARPPQKDGQTARSRTSDDQCTANPPTDCNQEPETAIKKLCPSVPAPNQNRVTQPT